MNDEIKPRSPRAETGRDKAYYEAHREAVLAQMKARRDGPDGAELNRRRRERHAANPEKRRSRARNITSEERAKRNEQHRNWRKANLEEQVALRREYRKGRPEWSHGVDLKKKFGIGRVEYVAMLDAQGGVCAICQRTEPNLRRRNLSVDHDHVTGRIRALLCSRCNSAIGFLEDDPVWLERAAAYLRSHLEAAA